MNYAAKWNEAEENMVNEKHYYYGPNTKLIPNKILAKTLKGKNVHEPITLPVLGEGRRIRFKEDI